MEIRKKSAAKGQTSIEFLYVVGFMLLLFTIIMKIHFIVEGQLLENSRAAEARRICVETAAQLSAVAAAGDGTNVSYLPPFVSTGETYDIVIFGNAGAISVNYGDMGTTCLASTRNITLDGSALSRFPMPEGGYISYSNGGVAVG